MRQQKCSRVDGDRRRIFLFSITVWGLKVLAGEDQIKRKSTIDFGIHKKIVIFFWLHLMANLQQPHTMWIHSDLLPKSNLPLLLHRVRSLVIAGLKHIQIYMMPGEIPSSIGTTHDHSCTSLYKMHYFLCKLFRNARLCGTCCRERDDSSSIK